VSVRRRFVPEVDRADRTPRASALRIGGRRGSDVACRGSRVRRAAMIASGSASLSAWTSTAWMISSTSSGFQRQVEKLQEGAERRLRSNRARSIRPPCSPRSRRPVSPMMLQPRVRAPGRANSHGRRRSIGPLHVDGTRGVLGRLRRNWIRGRTGGLTCGFRGCPREGSNLRHTV
jgi:hypothetical protein